MTEIIDESTKVIDDVLIVGGLAVGAYLIYTFYPELSLFWKTGEKTAEETQKLVETLDPVGAVQTTGDVASALFSGDTEGTLEGLEDASGILAPVGKATTALANALGVKTQRDYDKKAMEIRSRIKEECKSSDFNVAPVDAYPVLHEYNDWRPEENQKAWLTAMQQGVGTADQIFSLRNNHLLNGVRGGKGGPLVMALDWNSSRLEFTTVVASTIDDKAMCTVEGADTVAQLGLVYILASRDENWNNYENWPWHVDVLNAVGIHARYFDTVGGVAGYMVRLELDLLWQFGLTYDLGPNNRCIFRRVPTE
jgi:hypothetical protein